MYDKPDDYGNSSTDSEQTETQNASESSDEAQGVNEWSNEDQPLGTNSHERLDNNRTRGQFAQAKHGVKSDGPPTPSRIRVTPQSAPGSRKECRLVGTFSPEGIPVMGTVRLCEDIYEVSFEAFGQEFASLELTKEDASATYTTSIPAAVQNTITIEVAANWEEGTVTVSTEYCYYAYPPFGGWHCMEQSETVG